MSINPISFYYSPLLTVILTVFVSGWVSTYLFRNQLLISLLSLEFLVLSIFLGFVYLLITANSPISFSLYLLVLGACEATLGLCLLVTFVRTLGNDMLSNLELVNC